MRRSSFALFIVLLLTVGLVHGAKSPPYDPKTGVYTIDWDPPKDQNQQNAPGQPVTPYRPAQAVPLPTYSPADAAQEKLRQDRGVAEYERRYRERQQAQEAAQAAEQARIYAEEQRKVAEEQRKKERKEDIKALGKEIGRHIHVDVWD